MINPIETEAAMQELSRMGFTGFVLIMLASVGFLAAYAYLKGKR